MVYGPRAGLGTWLAVGATTLALCVPLAIVVVGARSSHQPSPAPATANPTPTASDVPGRLDAQLTSLPIVISDFSDPPSQAAASEYSSLRVQQATNALTMLSDTWRTLNIDVSYSAAVSRLRDYLVSLPSEADLQKNPGLGVHATAAPALPGLVSDQRNADRMNNAAVALFDLGVSWDQGITARRVDAPQGALGGLFELRAIALLHEVDASFPPNRAVSLNQAYLTSVVPIGCGLGASNLRRALVLATNWLDHAPDDVLARLLVASLETRDGVTLAGALVPGNNDQPAALAGALATLDSLTKNNATAALASAAKGDAYLAAASAVSAQAPYLARHYAEQARQAYVSALLAIDDPGLWAAEAASLGIIGDMKSALEAQRAAVALAPGSAELALGLALEEERAGDFKGMQGAAHQALTMALAGSNPLFREARFVASGGAGGPAILGDRGYMGYSFGSDRQRLPIYFVVLGGGCGGGGFYVTNDVVPVIDARGTVAAYNLQLPDAAVLTELAASVVLSDSAAAEADVQQWMRLPGSNPAAQADERWLRRARQVGIALQAVHLIANRSANRTDLSAAAFFAQSSLRHSANAAGQVRLFARAAALCQMEAKGEAPFDAVDNLARLEALHCEGESAYHARDYVNASAALEKSYSSIHDPQVGIEAAIAMWKAGQLETARHLLLKILSGQDPKDPTTYLGAHEILGELLLDEGDPRAAIDRFEETLNGINELMQSLGTSHPLSEIVPSVAQHAYNNHGVALLWRAQNAPGTAPDCGRDESVCKQARDDFAAAISMDPNNPYYLQNAAWSDRLLNHMSASRNELATAASSDPSDYPVLNDLGVMAAVDGDLTTAKREFQASLQAQPDYDLAVWNLGVVDMQLGFDYIPAAQGYFARAIRVNPELRGSPLEYLADNRIYRAAYGQPLKPSLATVTVQGYSSAALATGGIAALSALDDASGVEVKARLTELLRDIKLPVLARLIGPLRVWASRRRLGFPQRLPSGVRTWLLTGLVLAIGTIWTVLSRQGQAGGAELALAIFATGLAVLVHECGHLIAACRTRIRIQPAPSPLGILMSVVLLPLRISSGPYAGHRKLSGKSLKVAGWVYLAGPVANLLVAGLAYGLYLVQPFPLLQLIAVVQLAAAGFSLLPLEPLDGAAFERGKPEYAAAFSLLAAALALIAGLGGVAISLWRF